jgi:hypothetical protein
MQTTNSFGKDLVRQGVEFEPSLTREVMLKKIGKFSEDRQVVSCHGAASTSRMV